VKKILIIYSKTGGGHLSLAQALEDGLNHYFPSQFETHLIDPFPKIYASSYKTVGANFQEFWGKNFYLTNRPELAKVMHNLNDVVVNRKLVKIIKKEKPDAVLTTHFFASLEIEKALKKAGSKAKIIVAIADPFTPHAVWFTYKNADLYLSPTKEVTGLMVENGIEKEKIGTTGWLVRRDFRENCDEVDQKTLRKILGLDEAKFTIFLGGSGSGGGKIYELAKLLSRNQQIIAGSQIIILCGNHRQLMNRLMKLAEAHLGLLHLLPYVTNVRELMAASDVVIGKAGPNILFESIFMLKPFLATGCLPGQEDGNLEFIKRENLGWVMEEPAEAVELLTKLSTSNSASTLNPLIQLIIPNLKKIRGQNLDGAKNASSAISKLLQ